MNLAAFLLHHRTIRKLSARKLGELSGISHTEIHRIENGERLHPSPAVLKALAGALEVPFEDFMAAAGYLEKSLPESFLDANGLDEQELREVQDFIDFLKSRHR